MEQKQIIIRFMKEEDIELLASAPFPWSTPQKTKKKWDQYYKEQKTDIRIVCIVLEGFNIIGYGSLLFQSKYPYFVGHPEIQDLWIFEEHRKKGIGARLIGCLEEHAKNREFKEVGLGVGLYKDYGSAQKLYAHLGYLPDGRGVTYQYQPTIPGKSYPLDDDLVIWLKKQL